MDQKISVIITCYNSERFIRSSIESVLTQTHRNVECLVVDDGSTDQTGAIVAEIARTDDRVRYYYKENGGPGSARNYGFAKASGEWMHSLDADDWIAPDKLERQLQAALKADNNPRGVLVYSDYEIVFENDEGKVVKRVPAEIGKLSREQLLERVIGRKFGLENPSPITMNSILFSRSIFENHQFNETMGCAEDLEFYYRVLQDTIACVYVPMCSMYYRQDRNSISKDEKRSLAGYTRFVEVILEHKKEHLRIFPNMRKMIQRAVIYDDAETLENLRRILMASAIPVYINIRNREVNVRWGIAVAVWMRLWTRSARLLARRSLRKNSMLRST